MTGSGLLACSAFLKSPSFVLLVEVISGFSVANVRDLQPLFCFVSWRLKREIWNKQQGSPVGNMLTVLISGTHLNCLVLYRYSEMMLQTGMCTLFLTRSSSIQPFECRTWCFISRISVASHFLSQGRLNPKNFSHRSCVSRLTLLHQSAHLISRYSIFVGGSKLHLSVVMLPKLTVGLLTTACQYCPKE
jgi:hypothetical protein